MQIATSHLGDMLEFVRIQAPVAAGQATTNSTGVDTNDCTGVIFVVGISTIVSTGTVTITAQESDDNSSYSAISGASVAYTDADDNKLAVLDIRNFSKRYLRVSIVTATANGTIDLGVAIKYGMEVTPVTQGATVMSLDKT